VAVVASVANGAWASITQSGHGGELVAGDSRDAFVWACYFSVAWLVEGIRSK